jgi:Asp-tRNA(Asn)/Glu-tRNA(Gln) amidotransferase A subunit family amidase
MPTTPAWTDWSSLPPQQREAALVACKARTARLGRSLHAVVTEFDCSPSAFGALAALPYAAKDIFSTGLQAPSWGCAEPPVPVAPRALALHRLDEAGACLIAIAEMTELAYEPSGYNPVRGHAVNPWNVDFVTGGSSSGSAVLVASSCCYLALGSDSGGSVRIPAQCCGITALKPSWGAIPVDGAMPLAPSLDTIGIMARSAADLALVWPVISGRSADVAQAQLRATVLEDALAESHHEIAQACRQAIDVLPATGIAVSPRKGFPNEADTRSLVVMQAEAARTHRARLDDVRIDATLRKRLGKGLAISDNELAASLGCRTQLRADFLDHLLGGADIALLPAMPIKTPRTVEVDPASPNFSPRILYAMSRFTRFANYLGLPAIALPCGKDSRGMPIALQLVGRPNSDALLLDISTRLQDATNWHTRLPAVIAAPAAEKGIST